MTDTISLSDAALRYCQMGLSVVPLHGINEEGRCTCGSRSCAKPGKHPRIKWRPLTAKPLTEEQVKEHWLRNPNSNVGVITGRVSDLAILDIDGEEGVAALEAHGLPIGDLPPTPTVRTGGGGLHYHFRLPDDPEQARTGTGILNHVDIRAEGGLAVLPPSMHASGRRYAWVEGHTLDDLDPADFDFTLLAPPEEQEILRKERWYEKLLTGVGEGGRNDAAARLAGRYFGLGMTPDEVFLLLSAWNSSNHPPLPVKELRTIVRSIQEADRDEVEQVAADYLQTVSDVLGLNLVAVKRISGDDPRYALEFDQGTCMMSTAQLLSPKQFQQSIAEATKVVVRKLGARTVPTHERLAQMIIYSAEDVDAGEEATEQGELMLMLQDYLASQSVIAEVDAPGKAPMRGCFIFEECVWFSLVDLVQRGGTRWGTKPSLRTTAQTMRSMGFSRRVFVSEGVTRSMWGIEADRVPFIGREADSEPEEATAAA